MFASLLATIPGSRRVRSLLPFADLIACIFFAAVALASAVLSSSGAIRVFAALLLVWLLPGYSLSCLLWGSHSGLTLGDRIVLSVGLSVALIVFSALLLAIGGVGIDPVSVSVALAYETFALSGLAMAIRWSRRKQPPEEFGRAARSVRRLFESDRPFWTLVLALLVGAVVLVYLVLSSPPPPLTTELYLLGSDGTTESLPRVLTANQSTSLIVSVYNGEGQDADFDVLVCLILGNGTCNSSGAQRASWDTLLILDPTSNFVLNLSLRNGERVEKPLRFAITTPGNYVLQIALDGTVSPRGARLPLDVFP